MTDEELTRLLHRLGQVEVPPPDTATDESEAQRTATVAAMLRASTEPVVESPAPAPLRTVVVGRSRLRSLGLMAAALAAAVALGFAVRRASPSLFASHSPSSASASMDSAAHGSPEAPLAVAQATSAGVVVLHGHAAERIPGFSPARLEATDHVVTMGGGGAVVALHGDQALATLSASSELVVRPTLGTACEVTSGRAHFVVDKRSITTPFVVQARDVRVVVHGTTFDVSVDAAGEVRVHVDEGVVGVVASDPAAGEVLLSAGHDWSSRTARAAAEPAASSANLPAAPLRPTPAVAELAAESAAPRSPVLAPHASAVGAPAGSSPERGPDPSASTLAAQNELLRRAALARREGDHEQEKRSLDDFAARYPDAPGLHEAVVAAMRAAVSRGDERGARDAASRYLTLFPTGPLRDEAARVLR
jgi:hypothetical protein